MKLVRILFLSTLLFWPHKSSTIELNKDSVSFFVCSAIGFYCIYIIATYHEYAGESYKIFPYNPLGLLLSTLYGHSRYSTVWSNGYIIKSWDTILSNKEGIFIGGKIVLKYENCLKKTNNTSNSNQPNLSSSLYHQSVDISGITTINISHCGTLIIKQIIDEKNEEEKMVISTHGDYIQSLDIAQNGTILSLALKKNTQLPKNATIIYSVNIKHLSAISASDNTTVKTDGTVTEQKITLHACNKAQIKANLTTKNVTANVGYSSKLILSGSADYQKIFLYKQSEYDGSQCNVTISNMQINDSQAVIGQTKYLSYHLPTNKALLYYTGQCPMVDENSLLKGIFEPYKPTPPHLEPTTLPKAEKIALQNQRIQALLAIQAQQDRK